MSSHTVWGPSQSSKKFADGIVFHSTAGHGGFVLSGGKHILLQSRLDRPFETWAGGCNYEEDADAAVVVAVLSEFFPADMVERARNQILNSGDNYYGSVKEFVKNQVAAV